MKQQNIMKYLAAAIFILGINNAFADNLSEQLEPISREISIQVEKYKTELVHGQQEGMVQVHTFWSVRNTRTARQRRVSVTVVWGDPWTIETSCEAIEKEDRLYVAKSCYYPNVDKNQIRKKLNTKIIWPNQRVLILDKPEINTQNWVVLTLS